MANQDLYILKRGETAIGLEGFVIVLLLSLEYAEPSCHYLIGSTLAEAISCTMHVLLRRSMKMLGARRWYNHVPVFKLHS